MSQEIRNRIIERLPSAVCLGAVLYFLFRVEAAYSMLRSCVSQAAETGNVQICQSYPETIEGLTLFLMGSVLALILTVTYGWRGKSRNA